MLRQQHVSRVALLVAVAGVFGLLFFEQAVEVESTKIGAIDETKIGNQVKVNALVETAFKKGNVLFLQLYDGTGKIKAVLFSPKEELAAILHKGDFASIEGKVQSYENELEIIVEKAEEWR